MVMHHLRVCESCKNLIPLDRFRRRQGKKTYLKTACVSCINKKYKKTKQLWAEKNRKRLNEYKRQWFKSKGDIAVKKKKEWEIANRERMNDRAKARRKSDAMFDLKIRARNRINVFIMRRGSQKPSKTSEMLGCDWETLKLHIESKFKNGMTWENRSEWHIDHIIPLDSAVTDEDVERLCHYTNLQPLWASENIAKGAKRHEGNESSSS